MRRYLSRRHAVPGPTLAQRLKKTNKKKQTIKQKKIKHLTASRTPTHKETCQEASTDQLGIITAVKE